MNKLYSAISIFCILFFLGGDLIAQTVNINAEIRPRFEFRHGYKTLFPDNVNAANFISQRTRLNGFYKNELFSAYLSLQDLRVWGDVDQLNVQDVNGLAIHEAWGQIRFCDVLSLKVGRQEINYDNQRIFGGVGWAQQARSHDAAIFKFSFGENNKLDAGIAYNAMRESLYEDDYELINYKTIQWLHYHGDYGNSGLSILFLNNGLAFDAPSDTSLYDQKVVYSQTFGAYYTLKAKKINVSSAVYYQGGKNAKNNELQAYYFAADVGFNATDWFSVGLGLEYLSGTSTIDRQSGETDKSFTPFYGTNHKFNGFMDYFYVGNYVGQNGLVDIFLPLKFSVNKWSFSLTPHYFQAAATVSSYSAENQNYTDYSNGLGTEIDFVIGYNFSKSVNIQGGYSQMLATETMQVVKYPNDISAGYYQNTNNWAWVMITFKPTFFNSDNKK